MQFVLTIDFKLMFTYYIFLQLNTYISSVHSVLPTLLILWASAFFNNCSSYFSMTNESISDLSSISGTF